MDLQDKVVLVTGGARGLGAAFTRGIVAAGGRVVIGDLLDDEGAAVAAELGAAARYVHLDVTSEESWTAAVTAGVEAFGRLDGLVNNAGISATGQLTADEPTDVFRRIIEINLIAVHTGLRAVVPAMRTAGGGSIVNISSVSAVRPSPGTAAYGAAKAGVDSLTTSLAMEWGPKVRVNCIDVGLVRTADTADHYGSDATVAAIERTIPARRMARFDEIGNVAAFLASDLATYVSGASVACHGGGEMPVFLHIFQNTGENS